MGLFGKLGDVVGVITGVPVLGDILEAFGSSVDANKANEDSLKAQMEMAKYTSDLEQANWYQRFYSQNRYNSPSNMRQRLEVAGLNPNLVYGALSPNMAANPHAGTHSGQLSAYQNAFQMSMAVQQQQLEKQRIENERIVAESQAEKNKADAGLSRVEAKRQGIKYDEEYWWHNFGGSDEDGNPTNEYLWQKQLMYGFGIKEKEWQGSHDTYINIPKAIIDNYGQQNKHLQAQIRSLDGMLKIAGEKLELDKKIGHAQARELYAMAAHYFALSDRTQKMTVFDVGNAAQQFLNAVKDGKIKENEINILLEDWEHAKKENQSYWFDNVFNKLDRIAGRFAELKSIGVRKQGVDYYGRDVYNRSRDVDLRERGYLEEEIRYDKDGNPKGSYIRKRRPR